MKTIAIMTMILLGFLYPNHHTRTTSLAWDVI
jgi:hypothetical protein